MRRLDGLLGVMAAATWLAAAPAGAQDKPFAARGAFVALQVQDLDASARWYAEAFDLRVVVEADGAGSSMVALEGDGLLVELIADPAAGERRRGAVLGQFKAGFMVSDLDAAVAALRARGVTIAGGPYPASAEQRANVLIRDNEGNYLQLFGDYAR